MNRLLVEALAHRRGNQAVLRGVDLAIPAGSIVALLGPSGCGKTTLLRLIAGFEPADEGRITLDGTIVQAPGLHVPAERRHIGYVPQEGTLFPHLTIEANVAFGLTRAQRRSGAAADMLRLTGLEPLAARYPHQLSGGQQQRTALARALAPRPGLVLLDEPFAALDRALRLSVCADVIALLRTTGATAILVTHDPQEAFASADTVAAMGAGLIQQHADPETLYRRPADPALARLTGATLMLPAHMQDGRAATPLGLLETHPGAPRSGLATAMIRPEQVEPCPPGTGTRVRVRHRAFRGDHVLLAVESGGTEFDLPVHGQQPSGDTLELRVAGPIMAYPAPG